MNKIKILVFGYGINSNRTEAISKSTLILAKANEKLHLESYLISLEDITGLKSILSNLFARHIVISHVSNFIDKHKITHLIDVFALPASSLYYTYPLSRRYPNLKIIKEIQNEYGNSKKLTVETFIRLFANNEFFFKKVLNYCNTIFTRNYSLSLKYGFKYLPSYVPISNIKKVKSSKYRICYLGHPLTKKGVDLFPQIINILPKSVCNKITFSFAFSNIGKSSNLKNEISEIAEKKGIKVNFQGTVNPSEFFRTQDIFLLPIQDEYGAASTPYSILESMEAGCVPMTFKIKSVEGLLDSSNSILLKEHNPEKIVNVLMDHLDHTRLAELSKNSIKIIKRNNTYSLYLQKLKGIYES